MKPKVYRPNDFLDLAAFQRKSAANALKSDLKSHGMEARLNDERTSFFPSMMMSDET
jgi:hypothetical protein